MMKIEDKAALYLGHLKLLYEICVQENDEVDINLILKGFLQRKAMELQVSQSELIKILSTGSTVLRRKIMTGLLLVEEEIETDIIRNGVALDATRQYRYSLANIQEFYKIFAGRKISRQAINQQKRILLPIQDIPNEYTSVIESDLIEYFYTQTGIKLDVQKIRPLAYKKPLQEREI
ncbi:hypothetical protein ACMA1I_16090 [Pontibacter sp. 13R65]|uniref:hypothetical protein n=1 Tax=Pontibacter sp. 13R65 TaxID=3127458 RepID=UPI00301C48D8